MHEAEDEGWLEARFEAAEERRQVRLDDLAKGPVALEQILLAGVTQLWLPAHPGSERDLLHG